MDATILMSVIISFAISVVLGPVVIPFLKRLKVGQTVRDEGPKEHLKKNGTPTMGGILILISIVATSILYVKEYPRIIPILFVTMGFGLIGFLDDYIKVVLKRSMGLRAWQKMALQLLVTGVFAYYITHSLAMKIPFMPGVTLDLGVLNIPFLFFIVLGTVNGANFTDGLDGLASSVTVLIATFFTVIAIGLQSGIEPVTCAVVGALLGFLLFNGERFYGGYGIFSARRLCGGDGLYAANAGFSGAGGFYLCGRGIVRHDSGVLF
jgi:phospho-N-acetylmuramoyl-pentapeptide-transferase